MKVFFRITYYVVVVLLFLSVALLGFTQTKTFRTYLRSVLISEASRAITGTLSFHAIRGNLLTGAQIDSLVIEESGHILASIKRLEVRYDPFSLLLKRVSLSKVKVIDPNITLLRSKSGTWNIERLVGESTSEPTSSEWTIDIRNLEIENGSVALIDSLALRNRTKALLPEQVDYANLKIRALAFATTLRITPGSFAGHLRNLRFQMEEPDFSVKSLTGEFLLSNEETRISRLTLKTTDSDLSLNARLERANVLSVSDFASLERALVNIDLNARQISFKELKQLVDPDVDFLDKSASLQLTASGTVGDLYVRHVNIQTERSAIKAEGKIANLHRPKDVELDIVATESRLEPDDLLTHLPGLHLPDLRFLEAFDFQCRFTGRPDLFALNFEGTLNAGSISVVGKVDDQLSPLGYEATVAVRGLNLEQLFDDEDLRSNLNVRAQINGAGTNMNGATAIIRAEIDSSEFWGMPFDRSIVVSDLANRTLRTRISLVSTPTRIDASSEIQFFSDSTRISIQGRTNSLNLAQVLKDKKHESDLTFDFTLASNGFDLEHARSRATVNFFRSSFGEHEFDQANLQFVDDFSDPSHKVLELKSTVADLRVEGAFTLPSFISNLQHGMGILAEAITHRIASLDTLRRFGVRPNPISRRSFVSSVTANPEPVNVHFQLQVHDLYPVGVFARLALGGKLDWKGALRGSLSDLEFSGTSSIDWFQFRDESVLLTAFQSTLTHDIRGLGRVNTLDSLLSSIELSAKRLVVNETLFSNTVVGLKTEGDDGTMQLRTLIDSLVYVESNIHSLFDKGAYQMSMPLLKIGVQGIEYENVESARLVLGRDGFRIDQLQLRQESSDMALAGYLNPFGVSDMQIVAKEFLLNKLRYFSRDSSYVEQVRDLGGIVNFSMMFRGSLDHPNMTLELTADGVRSKETVLGSLASKISYFEQLLKFNVELQSRSGEIGLQPDLVMNGTLPYDLALAGPREKDLPGEMNVSVRSRGIRLELLDPFISVVSNMTGTVVCDVTIRGATQDPLFEGFISLQGARFLFVPLGIRYALDGRFVPNGRRVAFENVTVRNVETDRTDGAMNVTGTFALRGLSMREFDLTSRGQLLVMKEAARQLGQSLFGNLFIATSPTGVNWRGSPNRSFVTGEVFVRNANLTFPASRGTFIVPNKTVTVTFIDDTANSAQLTELGNLLASTTNGSFIGRQGGIQRTATQQSSRLEPEDQRSFLDNIIYDVKIETQGITQVRFVFNPLTGEELFADVRGRLAFTKNEEQTRLTGEVEVTSRSYYSFIQKFEATGKLLFTGDPVNPELNVLARYEGIHRPDSATNARSGSTDLVKEQRIAVILEITGTRTEPKVKIDLERERDGKFERWERADVEVDAIAFLMSGVFHEELTHQQQSSILGTNILAGLTSSVLSGPLTEFFRKQFGVIRSVDVLFYGGRFQETPDVRITGELGDAVIRFGGRVFNGLDNANVSVQFPMSSVVGSERWRNLVFELDRRDEIDQDFGERRKANSARLIYRISF